MTGMFGDEPTDLVEPGGYSDAPDCRAIYFYWSEK